MYKLVVFSSGNGSNLQALIDAQNKKVLPIEITRVICNNPNATTLDRCSAANIGCSLITKKQNMSRNEYDAILLNELSQMDKYDMIVLAGWMYILSDTFLQNIPDSIPIINLHPALPGQFPGANAISAAFTAFKAGKIEHTGIMVHNVVSEVDAGKVISQMNIPIYDDDTVESLKDRISFFEKSLLLESIAKVIGISSTNDTQVTHDSASTSLPTTQLDSQTPSITIVPQVLSQPISIPTPTPTPTPIEKTKFGKPILIYSGKVREMYDIGYGLLAMQATDRQSAFDRQICTIPGKGLILNLSSGFWFNLTKHIVPNHLVSFSGATMICKKAKRLDVEVVVRGYIAGSTSTSLWTHYSNGKREYCGLLFPDGMQKNQKLPEPIVTPTTKGEKDEPISGKQVVEQGLMTKEQWDYVSSKALELFNFGTKYADERGLILVDTKYEFGIDNQGNIMLIDEIHTCDSSRYWMKDTYDEKFILGQNPESLDKDVVRNFIVSKCDPYTQELPPVPQELINRASNAYFKFYNMISDDDNLSFQKLNGDLSLKNTPAEVNTYCEQYFKTLHSKRAIILAGSSSDQDWIDKIRDEFEKEGIYSMFHISSAHKNTRDVLELLDLYSKQKNPHIKTIFVAVAGMSNALGGVLSANTEYPVINCPPLTDKMSLFLDVWSSIRNPSYVPAMLILSPTNVAVACKKMFDL